ncbi:uncharacterized protein A4U43_C03F26030 [Asparagus officinalis]|uniref:Uncharacterized protein n=1 Tax=Asparagus officinalis TaxID=4686 RepID=A0A5P1FFV4_ASPOF|nr:uncharacterized protein A4U43_C03F26030 [Asparagus officinalis]
MDSREKPGAAMEQLISMASLMNKPPRPSQPLAPTPPSPKPPTGSSPPPPPNPQPDLTSTASSKAQNPSPIKCPLSDRMRPKTLAQILGQDHLLSPTSVLPSSLSRAASPPSSSGAHLAPARPPSPVPSPPPSLPPLCVPLRRHRRRQGSRARRRRRRPQVEEPHRPLRRRDPSLLKIPARFVPPRRRGRIDRPRRRHHGEPVLPSHYSVAVEVESPPPRPSQTEGPPLVAAASCGR